MKNIWVAGLLLMLFSACHHNDKQQQKKEITPTEVVIPPVANDDTIVPPPSHSSSPTHQEEQRHTLQRDTAEITNLRLFRRKQKGFYNRTLMVGEWLKGTDHEQDLANGKGYRWDTGEDIQREEAQSFTWTLDSNLLTFKMHLEFGALVIREYLVTFVDEETLVYQSAYGDSYMWEKVPSFSRSDSTSKAEE